MRNILYYYNTNIRSYLKIIKNKFIYLHISDYFEYIYYNNIFIFIMFKVFKQNIICVL